MSAENKCIEFHDDNQFLTILIGTQGEIPYKEIQKVSVMNEDAKYKGKTEPFVHQVLGGTTFYSMLGEPSLYVGLKIVLKDGTVKAAYISDRKTVFNTDIYREDQELATQLKAKIDRAIS